MSDGTGSIQDRRRTPVEPTAGALTRLRPIGAARIDGGFWAPRQQVNGADAITAGLVQLESFGNLANLRIAGGLEEGTATGPVFADSDVYKWIEAVAWEYRREPSDALLEMQRNVTSIIAAAQEDDGYLDSTIQIREGRAGRYRNLPWSHEHYCAGHLIQAAVAQRRCTGDTALLDVAVRLADHLVATFGPGKTEDIDGHPVIETALVELYRETGTAAYLELASWFVDARGHGIIAQHGKEPTYFSDRVPVREATTLEGHAVRAVYLATGAADVAIEQDDAQLLSALAAQFDNTMAEKTYLTGGLGSRWEGEAFGDPFELPPDRAYAETCAAIGGIQWTWRMLLATGEAKYADAMERMLYNGFLAGVSLTGTEYFYVNPLQLRSGAHADENRSPAHGRRGWFECACCPPNIMRMLSSLDAYLGTHDDSGLQLHHFAASTVRAPVGGHDVALRVETDYPFNGSVRVTIDETGDDTWALSLRMPGWAGDASLSVNGSAFEVTAGTYAVVDRRWSPGDVIELVLPMVVRETEADPRIDSIRGCTALERGPLVYALEQVDNDIPVDDVRFEPGSAVHAQPTSDLLGGVTTLTARVATMAAPGRTGWPYFPGAAEREPAASDSGATGSAATDSAATDSAATDSAATDSAATDSAATDSAATDSAATGSAASDGEATLIPYYAWANRDVAAMRVWIPRP